MTRNTLLLIASLLVGCQGMPADQSGESGSEIIGGTADNGDTSVVALLNRTKGELCTASLISPTVLLTAAHCTLSDPGDVFVAVFAPDLTTGIPANTAFAVKEVHHDPAFNINNLQAGHDIGIAILAQPSTQTPLPFNTAALSQAQVGQAIRIVGYGLNQGPAQTGKGAGTKRTATTTVDAINNILIQIGDNKKETCSGDSGGPAFMKLNGVETIVGVTSFGNQFCTNGGFDNRVDAFAAFIKQFVTPVNNPPPPSNTCAHSICAQGAALDAACDPCATQICAADSFCCTNSWDRQCVGEVATICQQKCQ